MGTETPAQLTYPVRLNAPASVSLYEMRLDSGSESTVEAAAAGVEIDGRSFVAPNEAALRALAFWTGYFFEVAADAYDPSYDPDGVDRNERNALARLYMKVWEFDSSPDREQTMDRARDITETKKQRNARLFGSLR